MSIANLLVNNNYNVIVGSLQFAGSGQSPLSIYKTGTFNLSIEGIWATPQTMIFDYTLIGKNVTLSIPQVFAAQTTSAAINNTLGSLLPAELRPNRDTTFSIRVRDVSFQNNPGLLILYADGSFEVEKSLSALTAFSGAGTGGFDDSAVSYLTA